MLVKMSGRATSSEIAAIEEKLHGLGYTTGKMVGEEITLIGVYGDITQLWRDSRDGWCRAPDPNLTGV